MAVERIPKRKPDGRKRAVKKPQQPQGDTPSLLRLGNKAVQRMIAQGVHVQRSGDGPAELDEATAGRINRERGGGQPLESSLQTSLGETLGQDFSGVRVHTSAESDALNHDLGAKAFTTGEDIFFREGEYDPHSTSGKELMAHELTHVTQQRAGEVDHGGRMTVNAPGDAFEQQAEATARQAVTGPAEAPAASIQRAPAFEEQGAVQMAAVDEEEEEIQKAAMEDEEEEEIQKADAEEEDELEEGGA